MICIGHEEAETLPYLPTGRLPLCGTGLFGDRFVEQACSTRLRRWKHLSNMAIDMEVESGYSGLLRSSLDRGLVSTRGTSGVTAKLGAAQRRACLRDGSNATTRTPRPVTMGRWINSETRSGNMRGRACVVPWRLLALSVLLGTLCCGTTAASTRALMASGNHLYELHDKIKLFANKVGPFGSRASTRLAKPALPDRDYACVYAYISESCLRACS